MPNDSATILHWAFMRTLSLVFEVALVVACEKAPTRTEHNVKVTREIRDDDKFSLTTWYMRVDSVGIDFYRLGNGIPHMYSVKFGGTNGQNVLSVFNTFSQWAATARANHVEPFSSASPLIAFFQCTVPATRR